MKNKKKKKGIKAWLITWEWINNAAAVADKIVAVLNPRWTVERVVSFVEIVYSMHAYTIEEIITFTRCPNLNPYRGEIEKGTVMCGHNPWLEARKVSDLIVEVDEKTKLEIIMWNELPKYKLIDGEIKQIRGPLPQKFSRRIAGPPSSMAIYDRAKGSFKPGWGPDEIPARNDL